MKNCERIIAIIPARGSSKRLPRKNILRLKDKPLLAWSIDAAKNCALIDRVIVSTDDSEIAKAALAYGAEVPFMRPDFLATDITSMSDTVLHAIKELELSPEDIVVILQPTSPLRNSEDIEAALILLKERQADGVISVCPCEHPPQWSNTLPDNLSMNNFLSHEILSKRSQDFPPSYRLNGAIFAFSVIALMSNKGISYGPNVFAYVMRTERSVDIDTQNDFDLAEFLMSKIRS